MCTNINCREGKREVGGVITVGGNISFTVKHNQHFKCDF